MVASEVIARVTSTVDYLRVTVVGVEAGEAGDRDWLPCAPLVDDPDALLALVRSTAAGRGTDRDDVAMSLFVQGYAFRVASLAIGGWLLDGAVIDVSPSSTSIALGRDRPNAVRLDRADVIASGDRGATLPVLQRHLLDDHLARLVATAHGSCRIGEALLWGNVGASCASSFGAFMDPRPERHEDTRAHAEEFFAAARPEVARSGRLVRVGSRWAWERSACCLWYQTESGFKCEDCSLWSADERAERYAAMSSHDASS
jgi:ferric iron reductase protein FhuF